MEIQAQPLPLGDPLQLASPGPARSVALLEILQYSSKTKPTFLALLQTRHLICSL